MDRNKPLFRLMKGSRYRLDNFFANSLDEKDHEGAEDFFKKIKQLIRLAYQRKEIKDEFIKASETKDLEPAKKANQDAIDEVFGTLRLIHFLKRKDND